jgi:hypothetical protein
LIGRSTIIAEGSVLVYKKGIFNIVRIDKVKSKGKINLPGLGIARFIIVLLDKEELAFSFNKVS